MATARRPTVTIIRIRTIMIPAITTPGITKGRCITIKTAIPTNRRATTIPVFTKLKRTTIRMATAMNRNQTIRPLSQRRSDWLVKAISRRNRRWAQPRDAESCQALSKRYQRLAPDRLPRRRHPGGNGIIQNHELLKSNRSTESFGERL